MTGPDTAPNSRSSSPLRKKSPGSDIPTLALADRVDIAFENIEYNITIGTGKEAFDKPILKGVTSRFQAGKLTVILGASGAGKTSLLNVIAGETKIGKLSGKLLLNGQSSTGAAIKSISGFVHQEDVILGTMTVQEAVGMSAKLRLPHTLSEEDRIHKVDEIITMLGLAECRTSTIGTATMKGISGGQKKRVAMGMDLISNPSVVFLDEPTSGLDTYTAYAVVKLLKELAASGRTVIATLHQPSSEIFHMIDELCIMSAGCIMYSGPAEVSVDYFARTGYPTPTFSNPADFFFMEILGAGVGSIENAPYTAEERVPKLLEVWQKSPENAIILNEISHPSRTDGITKNNLKYESRFVDQFPVLLNRALRNALRNKLIIKAKIAQSAFLGVLMGLESDSLHFPSCPVQNRSGVLFFIAINMVMSNAMGILSVFASEKQVFEREFGAGYYSLPAFFLTKVGVELPFQLTIPVFLVAILYWMVGLQNNALNFVIMAAFAIVMSLCGTAIGTLAACAFNELAVALVLVPIALLPLNVMIFSGLFVNTGDMYAWLSWIKWISPMHYGFVGMAKNEYTGLVMCDPNNSAKCIKGETVLTNLGFDDEGSILLNFLIVLGIWIVLLILSYFALWRVVSNTKRVDFAPAKDGKKASIVAPALTAVTVQ
ncbi:P-loop containing nucleoside triphosphate hydrolase protein [Blastocladiella britannica]|nr:P-loop containing nucleoside triphosphate hydrolase protein [Blastocladiella britannica]